MPTASAIRYAKAVFQLAVERDELENWLEDLTQLADSVTNRGVQRDSVGSACSVGPEGADSPRCAGFHCRAAGAEPDVPAYEQGRCP